MLSIDVEEWYHLNYKSMPHATAVERVSRVRANTERLLSVMEASHARATFFFLGSVAERDPQLVRDVQACGHEIGSHGYAHHLAYDQTQQEFADDVARSVDVLTRIVGQPIRGYRAPSWSIDDRTPWAYEVLCDLGFAYDASLFPFRTYLYGDSQAPTKPFVRRVGHRTLVEVPATVLTFGRMRLPFGGGFYFRAMPYWLTSLASKVVNSRGQAVVYYLHPREIDPHQPRLALSRLDYLVTYVGLRSAEHKLSRVLGSRTVVSIGEYIDRYAATFVDN